MERALPLIIAGIGGTVLGGIVMWIVAGGSAGPQQPSEPQQAQAELDDRPTWEEFNAVTEALKEARDQAALPPPIPATTISEEELEAALAERNQANARVKELEQELEEIRAAMPPMPEVGSLAVPFGKWAELPEVRDADWAEIGGAAHAMIPMLKELADAIREGKEMPPALGQKIGEQNRKLIAYWARVAGKLPTHADVNGEFTHPINLANMLAAQLEAAGDPLSQQQVDQISKLGEEFDRRWNEKTSTYNDSTFSLEKLIDEGELKEWFKTEMLRVCTPSQRAIAVPPSIDGLVGLDLYSAGLIFQMGVVPVTAKDQEEVKSQLMRQVSSNFSLDSAIVDGVGFLFDEWLLSLQSQLQPKPQVELHQLRTPELIQSGRAQLKAMRVLHSDYARDDAAKEALKTSTAIIYPRILIQ